MRIAECGWHLESSKLKAESTKQKALSEKLKMETRNGSGSVISSQLPAVSGQWSEVRGSGRQ
jgi:hypothetical protein